LAQSRTQDFYLQGGVPDTLDGRFELLVLHVFLVLRRLKSIAAARDLAQTLFRVMIEDLEENLRESGVGDMGVGRNVKQMVRAFYGRVAAYDAALAENSDFALDQALKRNAFGSLSACDDATVRRMGRYVALAGKKLEGHDDAQLLEGKVVFPSVPGPEIGS
jgi:cytochrome b pre-mRNA-processing protein 3